MSELPNTILVHDVDYDLLSQQLNTVIELQIELFNAKRFGEAEHLEGLIGLLEHLLDQDKEEDLWTPPE